MQILEKLIKAYLQSSFATKTNLLVLRFFISVFSMSLENPPGGANITG